MIDPQEEEVQVEGEAPMRFLENVCCLLDILISTDRSIGDMKLPRLGWAEKLKLQEAIPPFSLIEDSIHGMRADMLV